MEVLAAAYYPNYLSVCVNPKSLSKTCDICRSPTRGRLTRNTTRIFYICYPCQSETDAIISQWIQAHKIEITKNIVNHHWPSQEDPFIYIGGWSYKCYVCYAKGHYTGDICTACVDAVNYSLGCKNRKMILVIFHLQALVPRDIIRLIGPLLITLGAL
jgi:hypothetical protein